MSGRRLPLLIANIKTKTTGTKFNKLKQPKLKTNRTESYDKYNIQSASDSDDDSDNKRESKHSLDDQESIDSFSSNDNNTNSNTSKTTTQSNHNKSNNKCSSGNARRSLNLDERTTTQSDSSHKHDNDNNNLSDYSIESLTSNTSITAIHNHTQSPHKQHHNNISNNNNNTTQASSTNTQSTLVARPKGSLIQHNTLQHNVNNTDSDNDDDSDAEALFSSLFNGSNNSNTSGIKTTATLQTQSNNKPQQTSNQHTNIKQENTIQVKPETLTTVNDDIDTAIERYTRMKNEKAERERRRLQKIENERQQYINKTQCNNTDVSHCINSQSDTANDNDYTDDSDYDNQDQPSEWLSVSKNTTPIVTPIQIKKHKKKQQQLPSQLSPDTVQRAIHNKYNDTEKLLTLLSPIDEPQTQSDDNIDTSIEQQSFQSTKPHPLVNTDNIVIRSKRRKVKV